MLMIFFKKVTYFDANIKVSLSNLLLRIVNIQKVGLALILLADPYTNYHFVQVLIPKENYMWMSSNEKYALVSKELSKCRPCTK